MQPQTMDAGGCHDGSVTATAAIVVNDLSKAYGAHEAVRGLTFSVRRGEVFGLLGPNGAGKTTTVEILEGHRRRDGGEVSVLGHDPAERAAELRSRVGIVLQSCGTYPHLTVRETLEHWARLYPAPRGVDETIALAGPRGGRRPPRAHALGRPAAAAGLRARARRRPGADLPRRADDRLRPRGAARRVGGRARAARPRQDRPADHALPRRGAGARRPRGDRQGRPDPRRGPARRADRRRRALPRELPASATSWSSARPRTRRRCCTRRPPPRWRAASGSRSSRVSRPSLEDVYLELTAEARGAGAAAAA